MAKVTSKLQVTIPKKVAESYDIEPGAELSFEPAGPEIRLRIVGRAPEPGELTLEERLRSFREARERQDERDKRLAPLFKDAPKGRGWTREELYLVEEGRMRGQPR